MSKQEDKPSTYLTLSSLKERKWTDSMIRKLLGEPDVYKKNNKYRGSAPIKLYSVTRIEEVEKTEAFLQLHQKSRKSSKAARLRAEKARDKLLAEISLLEITVVKVNDPQTQAINSYNLWNIERLTEKASKKSPAEFLERITVNFIRHNLTHYDKRLEEIAGKVGVNEGVRQIRQKVFESIEATYPEYRDECKKQLLSKRLLH